MLSILIPAYNEAASIKQTIESLRAVMAQASIVYEIIVIDDGSRDETAAIAEETGVTVIRHPTNGGYGRALKTGMRHATYEWCAIADADGSYPLGEIITLLSYIPRFDMVVGARSGEHYWGSWSKRVGRSALLHMVEFVVGQRIPDVNSGFRIFRKSIALQHARRISSGFSFTTTLTLAMLLEEHFVQYVPIEYYKREGKSHVKMPQDTLRMLQILTQAILYYNPMKLFLLICIASVAIGITVDLGDILVGHPIQLDFLAASVLVAFIVGSLGLLAEVLRLNRVGSL